MRIISCGNEPPGMGQDLTVSEICSRHVLVFGEENQRKISQLSVGVVGTGGLGSIIIELLKRLFPRRLIYIDKDRVELSNLNRLVAATIVDVRMKTRKIDLATRNILTFNPNQEVVPIFGDFLDRECQEQFKECDFIFGASDSNAVRIAANRLCLAHGIPYLDCGVGAVVKDGQLTAAGGQIIKILPDSIFCLHCSELFKVHDAMNAFLSDDERQRQEDQGYIQGEKIAAPQVYALNMIVAAWAVWTFKMIVSGENLDFDGIAVDAKGFRTYGWFESARKDKICPTCGYDGIVFQGDDVDLLCRESDDAELDIELLEIQREQSGSNTFEIKDKKETANHTVDMKEDV